MHDYYVYTKYKIPFELIEWNKISNKNGYDTETIS